MNDLKMGRLIESVEQLVKNQDRHDRTHEKINSALEKLNDNFFTIAATEKAKQRNLKIYGTMFVVINIIIQIVQGVL